MKNIFAPFYQGEDDNKENVGTGIGLSLTRSIVLLHKGTISVSHNQPTGTIFKVYIPISNSAYSKDQLVTERQANLVSAGILFNSACCSDGSSAKVHRDNENTTLPLFGVNFIALDKRLKTTFSTIDLSNHADILSSLFSKVNSMNFFAARWLKA